MESKKIHETIERVLDNLKCPICLDLMMTPIVTKCDHSFCRHCILAVLERKTKAPCPICKQEITKRGLQSQGEMNSLVTSVRDLITGYELDSNQMWSPAKGPPVHLDISFTPETSDSTRSRLPRNQKKKDVKVPKNKTRNTRYSRKKTPVDLADVICIDDSTSESSVGGRVKSVSIENPSFQAPSVSNNRQNQRVEKNANEVKKVTRDILDEITQAEIMAADDVDNTVNSTSRRSTRKPTPKSSNKGKSRKTKGVTPKKKNARNQKGRMNKSVGKKAQNESKSERKRAELIKVLNICKHHLENGSEDYDEQLSTPIKGKVLKLLQCIETDTAESDSEAPEASLRSSPPGSMSSEKLWNHPNGKPPGANHFRPVENQSDLTEKTSVLSVETDLEVEVKVSSDNGSYQGRKTYGRKGKCRNKSNRKGRPGTSKHTADVDGSEQSSNLSRLRVGGVMTSSEKVRKWMQLLTPQKGTVSVSLNLEQESLKVKADSVELGVPSEEPASELPMGLEAGVADWDYIDDDATTDEIAIHASFHNEDTDSETDIIEVDPDTVSPRKQISNPTPPEIETVTSDSENKPVSSYEILTNTVEPRPSAPEVVEIEEDVTQVETCMVPPPKRRIFKCRTSGAGDATQKAAKLDQGEGNKSCLESQDEDDPYFFQMSQRTPKAKKGRSRKTGKKQTSKARGRKKQVKSTVKPVEMESDLKETGEEESKGRCARMNEDDDSDVEIVAAGDATQSRSKARGRAKKREAEMFDFGEDELNVEDDIGELFPLDPAEKLQTDAPDTEEGSQDILQSQGKPSSPWATVQPVVKKYNRRSRSGSAKGRKRLLTKDSSNKSVSENKREEVEKKTFPETITPELKKLAESIEDAESFELDCMTFSQQIRDATEVQSALVAEKDLRLNRLKEREKEKIKKKIDRQSKRKSQDITVVPDSAEIPDSVTVVLETPVNKQSVPKFQSTPNPESDNSSSVLNKDIEFKVPRLKRLKSETVNEIRSKSDKTSVATCKKETVTQHHPDVVDVDAVADDDVTVQDEGTSEAKHSNDEVDVEPACSGGQLPEAGPSNAFTNEGTEPFDLIDDFPQADDVSGLRKDDDDLQTDEMEVDSIPNSVKESSLKVIAETPLVGQVRKFKDTPVGVEKESVVERFVLSSLEGQSVKVVEETPLNDTAKSENIEKQKKITEESSRKKSKVRRVDGAGSPETSVQVVDETPSDVLPKSLKRESEELKESVHEKTPAKIQKKKKSTTKLQPETIEGNNVSSISGLDSRQVVEETPMEASANTPKVVTSKRGKGKIAVGNQDIASMPGVEVKSVAEAEAETIEVAETTADGMVRESLRIFGETPMKISDSPKAISSKKGRKERGHVPKNSTTKLQAEVSDRDGCTSSLNSCRVVDETPTEVLAKSPKTPSSISNKGKRRSGRTSRQMVADEDVVKTLASVSSSLQVVSETPMEKLIDSAEPLSANKGKEKRRSGRISQQFIPASEDELGKPCNVVPNNLMEKLPNSPKTRSGRISRQSVLASEEELDKPSRSVSNSPKVVLETPMEKLTVSPKTVSANKSKDKRRSGRISRQMEPLSDEGVVRLHDASVTDSPKVVSETSMEELRNSPKTTTANKSKDKRHSGRISRRKELVSEEVVKTLPTTVPGSPKVVPETPREELTNSPKTTSANRSKDKRQSGRNSRQTEQVWEDRVVKALSTSVSGSPKVVSETPEGRLTKTPKTESSSKSKEKKWSDREYGPIESESEADESTDEENEDSVRGRNVLQGPIESDPEADESTDEENEGSVRACHLKDEKTKEEPKKPNESPDVKLKENRKQSRRFEKQNMKLTEEEIVSYSSTSAVMRNIGVELTTDVMQPGSRDEVDGDVLVIETVESVKRTSEVNQDTGDCISEKIDSVKTVEEVLSDNQRANEKLGKNGVAIERSEDEGTLPPDVSPNHIDSDTESLELSNSQIEFEKCDPSIQIESFTTTGQAKPQSVISQETEQSLSLLQSVKSDGATNLHGADNPNLDEADDQPLQEADDAELDLNGTLDSQPKGQSDADSDEEVVFKTPKRKTFSLDASPLKMNKKRCAALNEPDSLFRIGQSLGECLQEIHAETAAGEKNLPIEEVENDISEEAVAESCEDLQSLSHVSDSMENAAVEERDIPTARTLKKSPLAENDKKLQSPGSRPFSESCEIVPTTPFASCDRTQPIDLKPLLKRRSDSEADESNVGKRKHRLSRRSKEKRTPEPVPKVIPPENVVICKSVKGVDIIAYEETELPGGQDGEDPETYEDSESIVFDVDKCRVESYTQFLEGVKDKENTSRERDVEELKRESGNKKGKTGGKLKDVSGSSCSRNEKEGTSAENTSRERDVEEPKRQSGSKEKEKTCGKLKDISGSSCSRNEKQGTSKERNMPQHFNEVEHVKDKCVPGKLTNGHGTGERPELKKRKSDRNEASCEEVSKNEDTSLDKRSGPLDEDENNLNVREKMSDDVNEGFEDPDHEFEDVEKESTPSIKVTPYFPDEDSEGDDLDDLLPSLQPAPEDLPSEEEEEVVVGNQVENDLVEEDAQVENVHVSQNKVKMVSEEASLKDENVGVEEQKGDEKCQFEDKEEDLVQDVSQHSEDAIQLSGSEDEDIIPETPKFETRSLRRKPVGKLGKKDRNCKENVVECKSRLDDQSCSNVDVELQELLEECRSRSASPLQSRSASSSQRRSQRVQRKQKISGDKDAVSRPREETDNSSTGCRGKAALQGKKSEEDYKHLNTDEALARVYHNMLEDRDVGKIKKKVMDVVTIKKEVFDVVNIKKEVMDVVNIKKEVMDVVKIKKEVEVESSEDCKVMGVSYGSPAVTDDASMYSCDETLADAVSTQGSSRSLNRTSSSEILSSQMREQLEAEVAELKAQMEAKEALMNELSTERQESDEELEASQSNLESDEDLFDGPTPPPSPPSALRAKQSSLSDLGAELSVLDRYRSRRTPDKRRMKTPRKDGNKSSGQSSRSMASQSVVEETPPKKIQRRIRVQDNESSSDDEFEKFISKEKARDSQPSQSWEMYGIMDHATKPKESQSKGHGLVKPGKKLGKSLVDSRSSQVEQSRGFVKPGNDAEEVGVDSEHPEVKRRSRRSSEHDSVGDENFRKPNVKSRSLASPTVIPDSVECEMYENSEEMFETRRRGSFNQRRTDGEAFEGEKSRVKSRGSLSQRRKDFSQSVSSSAETQEPETALVPRVRSQETEIEGNQGEEASVEFSKTMSKRLRTEKSSAIEDCEVPVEGTPEHSSQRRNKKQVSSSVNENEGRSEMSAGEGTTGTRHQGMRKTKVVGAPEREDSGSEDDDAQNKGPIDSWLSNGKSKRQSFPEVTSQTKVCQEPVSECLPAVTQPLPPVKSPLAMQVVPREKVDVRSPLALSQRQGKSPLVRSRSLPDHNRDSPRTSGGREPSHRVTDELVETVEGSDCNEIKFAVDKTEVRKVKNREQSPGVRHREVDDNRSLNSPSVWQGESSIVRRGNSGDAKPSPLSARSVTSVRETVEQSPNSTGDDAKKIPGSKRPCLTDEICRGSRPSQTSKNIHSGLSPAAARQSVRNSGARSSPLARETKETSRSPRPQQIDKENHLKRKSDEMDDGQRKKRVLSPSQVPETPVSSKCSELLDRSTSPVFGTGTTTATTTIVRPSLPMKTGRNLVVSGFNQDMKDVMTKFLETYGFNYSSKFSEKTTHVVVQTLKDEPSMCDRTLKYFLGISGRCWVLSFNWMVDSVEQGVCLPEDDYEIQGDSVNGPNHNGPYRARKAPRLLFDKFEIFCHGHFTGIPPGETKLMIKMLGARVVGHPRDFNPDNPRCYIIAEPDPKLHNENYYDRVRESFSAEVVSREWLLDSIAQYKIQNPKDYSLCTKKDS